MAESVRLSGIVMYVRNLERSVHFYTEVLGLPVVDRNTTAALLGENGTELILRASGENAAHPLGSLGVQYPAWATDSRDDLDRRADLLRQRSAYRETRTNGAIVTVEGRDPDDQVLILQYLPPGEPGLREIPTRIYAW